MVWGKARGLGSLCSKTTFKSELRTFGRRTSHFKKMFLQNKVQAPRSQAQRKIDNTRVGKRFPTCSTSLEGCTFFHWRCLICFPRCRLEKNVQRFSVYLRQKKGNVPARKVTNVCSKLRRFGRVLPPQNHNFYSGHADAPTCMGPCGIEPHVPNVTYVGATFLKRVSPAGD